MSPYKVHQKHKDAHEELWPIIIPIVSVISILAFIGVIGNAAVIYIYGSVLKKSTVHYFITVLAVFDFICCLLGLPLESIEVYYSMDYPSNGLCKWQRFLTFWCNIGSVSVLLLISIERYRKVCWPTNYQINLRHAKFFAIGVCFFSLLMTTPVTLFSNSNEIQLKNFGNRTGYDCHRSNDIWTRMYLIFLLIFAIVILITMIILYSLLYRKARTHLLRRNTQLQQGANNAGKSPARRQLSRTNRTVIFVTVLFVISFFPTLLLGVFRKQLTAEMGYKGQLVFFMFERMFILNSSFNPLVYGLCNKQFRHVFVGLLRRILCCCLPSVDTPTFSTETS